MLAGASDIQPQEKMINAATHTHTHGHDEETAGEEREEEEEKKERRAETCLLPTCHEVEELTLGLLTSLCQLAYQAPQRFSRVNVLAQGTRGEIR